MRWLTLHARARHVPATVLTALAAAMAIGWLADRADAPQLRLNLAVFMVAAVAAVAATGLAGADPALERTASVRWPARRSAHVVVMAAATVGVAALVVGLDRVVVRNVAGLTGLAALGVVALGGGLAWCLPLGWAVVAAMATLASPTPGAPLVTWPVQPGDSVPATWAALALGVGGTVAYALLGPPARQPAV